MPIRKPHKDESQSDWMHYCVPIEIGTGENKRPQDQAVAICLDMWRRAKKSELMDIIDGLAAILAKYDDEDKWARGQHTCPKCGHTWTVQIDKPKG